VGRADKAYNSCCLVSASLFIDYVFLDTDERRRMAQNPHEYLIEQLQFTGDESIGSTSNKIKLNFNHPCKELVWVVQRDCLVDYCASFTPGDNETQCFWDDCEDTGAAANVDCCAGVGLYSLEGAQPFNYSDAADLIMRDWASYGSRTLTQGSLVLTKGDKCCKQISRLAQPWSCRSECTTEFLRESDDAEDCLDLSATGNIDSATGWNTVQAEGFFTAGVGGELNAGGVQVNEVSNSNVSTGGVVVLGETSRKLHCWGENPVVTAKLLLNGQDRFSERLGSYFDVVQPYQHHTSSPDTGINVYSFALRPEEHQPSGTCNFSRIDNASLQLVVSSSAVGGSATSKVRVYATNYNVLRVMSGMGGLAYSN